MTKILPLYIACFFLGYLSDKRSLYDDEKDVYIYKEKTRYYLMLIIAIVFAGLRTAYNDTETYINGYNEIKLSDSIFGGKIPTLGSNPGFRLMEYLMKRLGFSSQSFIFITSAFCIGVSLWFVHKYTDNISLSVFLYFAIGYYIFTMAAIKQCVAISICLIAIDRQIQGKYFKFFILVLIAMTFHSFALAFLVSPLLEFKPWTTRTIVVFVIFVILGFSLQTWMGRIVNIAALMGEEFKEAALAGEGVNIFRVGVVWAPILLSIFTLQHWINRTDREQNIIMNLTMLNAGLMFVALFGNPIYFGRLANYFLLFQALSIPVILKCFEKNSKLFITACVVLLYLGYLYYGNVLNGRSFDHVFSRIGLIEYLGHIFN